MFRTPIGFHDAYVAAPSQKAALEAWGANTNLFAQGAAEQVTEPKLTKVPLEQPGEVIKVLRGNEAAQLKALGEQRHAPSPRSPAASVRSSHAGGMAGVRTLPPPRGERVGRKPSRAKVERAEAAVEELDSGHAKELSGLREQEQVLARKLREAHGTYREKRRKLEEKAESARSDYEAALRKWKVK